MRETYRAAVVGSRGPVFLQDAGEVGAAIEDHREVGPTVLLPGVEDLDDVGMLEPGLVPHLGDEALDAVAGQEVLGDHLQRHEAAVEPGSFPGQVDDAHAAATDPLEHLVLDEVGSRSEVGVTRGFEADAVPRLGSRLRVVSRIQRACSGNRPSYSSGSGRSPSFEPSLPLDHQQLFEQGRPERPARLAQMVLDPRPLSPPPGLLELVGLPVDPGQVVLGRVGSDPSAVDMSHLRLDRAQSDSGPGALHFRRILSSFRSMVLSV